MRNSLLVIAALFATTVSATNELQQMIECQTVTAGDNSSDYDAMVTLEECSADVTADTCTAAAATVDSSADGTDANGKIACVAREYGNCDAVTEFRCVYYQQSAGVSEQPNDWEPRTCGDNTGDWAANVTFDDFMGLMWDEDVADCEVPEVEEEEEDEDDEDDEEESATGVSAGVATLAIAFALNM